MLQAEDFHPPAENLIAKGATWDEKAHGRGGPVKVSFAHGMFGSIQQPALKAAQEYWGLKHVDAASGVVNGVTTIPVMLESNVQQNRSSPLTAYIMGEAQSRENLDILTGHRATQIQWSEIDDQEGSDHRLVARGVYYQKSRNSQRLFVKANREVILAAGSMQGPQLLELSGVGDPSVLSKAGIPLRRSLLGVGKNLQEQIKNALSFVPKSDDFDGTGPPCAIAFPNVHQILRDESSSVYDDTVASLSDYTTELEAADLVANARGTYAILKEQVDNLFRQNEAAAEIIYTLSPADGTVGCNIWNLIVLARGSIHIATNNSFDHPVIECSYFGHPLDLKLQAFATRQAHEVFQTEPLASMIDSTATPSIVPEDGKGWEQWVKKNFTSVWHPIGTLAMMKEEMGGVVDLRLKVYGTENVRVVDASVLPVQLSAHLSSTLYGIAEKAAVMIKENQT